MTIFDIHIIRRILTGFVVLVIALIVFFVVLHYVEYVDDFMDRGASMQDVFLIYYPNYIPEMVRLISPLAIFLSAVYLTGRLAEQLQIMALKAAGVSLYRLMAPYGLVALVITAFMFWFNGWIVPVTNREVLQFERQYLNDHDAHAEISDIHRQNRKGQILTVGYFDQESDTGHRVSLQHFSDAHTMRSRVDATRMEWVDSLRTWRMYDVVQRTFPADSNELVRTLGTIDTTLNLSPRDLAQSGRDVEEMSLPASAAFVQTLRKSGVGNLGRILVNHYSKFTYPLSNLILGLLALPIAAARRRGGQAMQMGLGLFVAFVYLALMKLVEPFGYSGALPPILAASLPHILFLVVAFIALLRAGK